MIIFVILLLYIIPQISIENGDRNVLNGNNIVEEIDNSLALPIRLKIPSLGIDAPVESLGLTTDGSMDVPKSPDNVGWFELGPYPGEIGSAVIAGHYGWKDNLPAVFDNLSKLKKTDKIYVEDKEGIITTFVVREIRSFGENDETLDVFNSTDGKAHLNLITCEGIWNASNKSYSKRLIVFTDREL
ncbi:MAG: class F sortase [Minisyncoccia bacterium]